MKQKENSFKIIENGLSAYQLSEIELSSVMGGDLSTCGGDACGGAACGGYACGANGCALNACGGNACGANGCILQLCPVDVCPVDGCIIDLFDTGTEQPCSKQAQKVVDLYQGTIVQQTGVATL